MAKAQRQEPSLVDRLLRPNMELQNSAQRKKFSASSAVVERRGTVGTFYLQPNRTEKSFAEPGSYTEYSISGANVGRAKSVSLVLASRELLLPRPTR